MKQREMIPIEIKKSKGQWTIWVNDKLVRTYSPRGLEKAKGDADIIIQIIEDLGFRVYLDIP